MSTPVPPQGDQTRTREIPRVTPGTRPGPDHREIVARQREEHGGMKFGAGFFGWLAATGMAVLLTALVAAVTAAVRQSGDLSTARLTGDIQTAGVIGGVVLLVIILLAYFCGGYVAGRMARFNGVKQGLAVWLWALVAAIVLGVIGAIAGTQSDVLSQVRLPSLSGANGNVTMAGIIAGLVVAAVALVGALLGGLAGMRFHRRVDRTGLV